MKRILIGVVVLSKLVLSADFSISIEKTLAFEGSKVFKSSFSEYSKYGVTKQTLAKFNKQFITQWKVDTLTQIQAELIYFKYYWSAQRLDEVDSQVVANNILDQTVHAGHTVASRSIQEVLADLTWLHNKNNPNNRLSAIKVDGVIGSMTISRLNYFTNNGLEKDIVRRLKAKRLNHLKGLNKEKNANGKTKWDLFKDNWTMRVLGL